MTLNEEKILIDKARQGDELSLNVLIDRYKDYAFSIARKYLNEDDAKDAVQEAFINVFLNIEKFRNESKFSSWLYRIIYNQCINLIRKNKEESLDLEKAEEKSDDEDPEESELLNKKLSSALKNLPRKDYTVVQLFYLAEKSVKDVEYITGLSQSNVKTILHRSRTKLKELMGSDDE